MFAQRRSRPRRGVVLILVLAMLSIVALTGVTFLSFSGQAQLGARSHMLGQVPLKPEAIFDFAISQLINDTNNPKSAIRGHSLLRDMYGNDATNNGYLAALPDGTPLRVVNAARNVLANGDIQYRVFTNIAPASSPELYGANYLGAVLRLQQWLLDNNGYAVRPIVVPEGRLDAFGRITHTFEVVAQGLNNGFLVFDLSPTRPQEVQNLSAPFKTTLGLLMPDYPPPPNTNAANLFELDGRYQRGFNGSGLASVSPSAPAGYVPTRPFYPNFLFNGPVPAQNYEAGGYNDPNLLPYQQLDEDYDAPDLENLFMGLVSADGQVVIPSFHRPGIVVYDPANPTDPAFNDWLNVPNTPLENNRRRAKFLRPRGVDHPRAAAAGEFPDLVPDPVTGKITYDVDNDGDGVTDSVWLDLGFPVQRDASGRLYKPLFSILVLPLNGRLPLNTAGNLHRRNPDGTFPVDATGNPSPDHAAHLGNSPSEIDPRFALRNENEQLGRGMLQVLLQGNPNLPNGPPEVGRYGEVELLSAVIAQGATAFPRAGRSYSGGSAYLDGLDSNFNTFDFFPQDATTNPPLLPEDSDLYDAIGRVQLPSERLRRFVTPIDPTGNGRVFPFNRPPQYVANPAASLFYSDPGGGFDRYGRVSFFQYFRPPGVPRDALPPPPGTPYPDGEVPHNRLNVYHGFESFRNPVGQFADLMARGPDNLNYTDNAGTYQEDPIDLPTFDTTINSTTPVPPANYTPPTLPTGEPVQVFRGMYPGGSLALHEADQLDLYRPNPYDAPFEPKDLEWLYRQGDVDSSSLDDRLARLVPDAFLDPDDPVGSRRRRNFFGLESWELNTYAATNSALPGAPPAVGFPATSWTPTLMHGGRKINLNYPLPHSNDPNEPTRQKWCQDTYRFLTNLLYPAHTFVAPGHPLQGTTHRIDPARGLDASYNPPEPFALPDDVLAVKLAEVGQFVVNIVDFRDPDAAMTRFVNPDLAVRPAGTITDPNNVTINVPAGAQLFDPNATPPHVPLVQYGMEYLPVALNEVLAFQTIRKDANNAVVPQKRLFIELANLLTRNHALPDPNDPNQAIPGTGTASDLDLNGWGFLITKDDPAASGTAPEARHERPNTVTGQLDPTTVSTYYVPIGGQGVGLPPTGTATEGAVDPLVWAMGASGPRDPQDVPGPNNFYVLSNSLPPATDEQNRPTTDGAGSTQTQMDSLAAQLPNAAIGSGDNDYYWLHLLRPADPTDPDSEKVVVDSIRFPFIENGVNVNAGGTETLDTANERILYAVGRLQPYRGGLNIPNADQFSPPFPYGYTSQISTQDPRTGNNGQNPYTSRIALQGSGVTNVQQKQNQETNDVRILHTLGEANRPDDPVWDYLPFHDRDFTSVAELLLVPSCPPGLFTKVFAEANGTTPTNPPATYRKPLPNASDQPPNKKDPIDEVHAFPYLADAFFYASYNTPGNATYFGQKTVGWHRMLEFFEVPSSMFGAVGPAAEGQNADWLRKDVKPGLLNINAIIDEEVFAGLMADERLNAIPAFVDEAAAARPYPVGAPAGPWPAFDIDGTTPTTRGVFGVPRVASAILPNGVPSSTFPISDLTQHALGRGIPYATPYTSALTGTSYHDYMKAAFSDFLKLRHGGSGLVFSPYSAAQAIWTTPHTPPTVGINGTQDLPERPFRSLNAANILETLMRPARLYDISDRFTTDTNGNLVILPPARRPETLQVPPRRLFQIPDAPPGGNNPTNDAAGLDGSAFANDAVPFPPAGAENQVGFYQADHLNLTPNAQPPYTTGAHPNLVNMTPDANGLMPFLGGNNQNVPDPNDPMQTINLPDHRRHPYFRTEWLQKVMNLTTVRSHQYAVWVTVGFFEVVREGNAQMVNVDPTLALDELGPEIGKAAGQNVRHRAFYVIDRTRATGFDPASPPDFRNLILHHRRIE